MYVLAELFTAPEVLRSLNPFDKISNLLVLLSTSVKSAFNVLLLALKPNLLLSCINQLEAVFVTLIKTQAGRNPV